MVLGHSLGRVVGLVLASGGFPVRAAVIGLGIKVAWARQELDRAQAAAHRPTAWFAWREEAAARSCASRVSQAWWPPTLPR